MATTFETTLENVIVTKTRIKFKINVFNEKILVVENELFDDELSDVSTDVDTDDEISDKIINRTFANIRWNSPSFITTERYITWIKISEFIETSVLLRHSGESYSCVLILDVQNLDHLLREKCQCDMLRRCIYCRNHYWALVRILHRMRERIPYGLDERVEKMEYPVHFIFVVKDIDYCDAIKFSRDYHIMVILADSITSCMYDRSRDDLAIWLTAKICHRNGFMTSIISRDNFEDRDEWIFEDAYRYIFFDNGYHIETVTIDPRHESYRNLDYICIPIYMCDETIVITTFINYKFHNFQ